MLSYRHAFHAGNHADALKHLTLGLLLQRLNAKDKPYFYLDTHAGAGRYALKQRYAALHQEYAAGVLPLLDCDKLQDLVPEYFAALKAVNSLKPEQSLTADQLNFYPGSPLIAAKAMRRQDRLTLIELHSRDFELLNTLFRPDRRVHCECRDGFAALSALLPPPLKRGLVLMDPSYELKSDYQAAVKAIKQGLSRFNTGIFALWYPVLGRMQDYSRNLTQELSRLRCPLLQVELRVRAQTDERGMCGSGLLILNYPYTLDQSLEQVMNLIYPRLAGPDGSAKLKVINPQA